MLFIIGTVFLSFKLMVFLQKERAFLLFDWCKFECSNMMFKVQAENLNESFLDTKYKNRNSTPPRNSVPISSQILKD